MRTIALRFAENFAPECGTIAAHQEIIDKYGHVWFGKMGSPLSQNSMAIILAQNDAKILLIRSGKIERYWAHIANIQKDTPAIDEIPSYYRNIAEKCKTWFKITKFEKAPNDILSKCTVASSGNTLNLSSTRSMNPFFIIDYIEGEE